VHRAFYLTEQQLLAPGTRLSGASGQAQNRLCSLFTQAQTQGTKWCWAGADAVWGGHGGPAGRDAGLPGHVQSGAVPGLHGRALRPPLALRPAPRLCRLPAGAARAACPACPQHFGRWGGGKCVQSLGCAPTHSLRSLLGGSLLTCVVHVACARGQQWHAAAGRCSMAPHACQPHGSPKA